MSALVHLVGIADSCSDSAGMTWKLGLALGVRMGTETHFRSAATYPWFENQGDFYHDKTVPISTRMVSMVGRRLVFGFRQWHSSVCSSPDKPAISGKAE